MDKIKIRPIKTRPIKVEPIKIKPIKVEPIRIPRGPTVRWDINYDRLFKRGKKK
jgi:hypothetical protein